MPRDEDEDLSTPLELGTEPSPTPRRPTPTTHPGAIPSHKPPSTIRWGAAGVVHQFGELVSTPGSVGVIRYVTSGVQYTPPPVSAAWRAVPSEPGRYEFPWGPHPETARTLRHLRVELERAARAGELNDPNHPLLRELDEVATRLVTLAGQLHNARWSLGLIQPDSVFIKGDTGNREIILADLGFFWKGSFGSPPWDDSPGRPDWLDPLTANRWLWEHDPIRQQFCDPDHGVYPPATAVSDVKTLGRLCAWLVSGQTSPHIPMVGGGEHAPAAWTWIAEAAAGRIPTTEALAAHLRAAPLSDYFAPLTVIAEPPRGKSHLVVALCAIMVLLVGGAAAAWYFSREKPEEIVSVHNQPSPVGPGPTLPSGSSSGAQASTDVFKQALADFDAAQSTGDIKGMFAALTKLAANTSPETKFDYATRRARAIDDWTNQVNVTIKRGSDPVHRLEVAARLDELELELKQLIEKYPTTDPEQQLKEQQCLDYVATFARQFGPPR